MLSAKVAYTIKKEREEQEKRGMKLKPVFVEYQKTINDVVGYAEEYQVYMYKTMRDKPTVTTIKDISYEDVKSQLESQLKDGNIMYELFLMEYGYYIDKTTTSRSLLIRKSIYSV